MKRRLYLLFVCLIAAAGIWFFREPDKHSGVKPAQTADSKNMLRWVKGLEQSYSFEIVNNTWMGDGKTNPPIKVFIAGRLNLRIFDVNKQIKLGFYLSPVSVAVNGLKNPGLEELYSTRMLVTADREGHFQKFFFPAAISEQDTEPLKGLVLPFEVIVKDETHYTAIQTGTLGTYQADYEKRPSGEITKTKNHYLQSAGQKAEDTTAIFDVIISKAVFSFDLSWHRVWLQSFSGEEQLRVQSLEKTPLFSVINRYQLNPSSEVEKGLWDNKSFAEWQQIFSSKKQIPAGEKPDPKLQQPAAKQNAANMEQLISALEKEPGRKNSVNLRDYLREHPEEILKLDGLLLHEQYSEKANMKLINNLGIIGTKEAQQVLSGIMEDPAQSDKNRFRAAISFSSIENPISKTTINSLLDRIPKLTPGDPDLPVNSTALLSLGTISQNLRREFPQDADKIGEALENTLESTALNSVQTKYILKSLGNTADPDRIETIRRYLTDEDVIIRRAAIESLRYMPGRTVETLLVSALQRETDSRLSAAAADTLANLDLSRKSYTVIAEKALAETDSNARRLLINLLASDKSEFSGRQEVLKRLLDQETSKVNAAILAKALRK
jgi:hypothetical protein